MKWEWSGHHAGCLKCRYAFLSREELKGGHNDNRHQLLRHRDNQRDDPSMNGAGYVRKEFVLPVFTGMIGLYPLVHMSFKLRCPRIACKAEAL